MLNQTSPVSQFACLNIAIYISVGEILGLIEGDIEGTSDGDVEGLVEGDFSMPGKIHVRCSPCS